MFVKGFFWDRGVDALNWPGGWSGLVPGGVGGQDREELLTAVGHAR